MITQDLQDKLSAIIMQKGMELYDVEMLKENDEIILRIYIFKKSGVTLNDCEMISKLIDPMLDVELTDIQSYHLEVSSPGIERTLKKPQHFLCSIGQKVAATLPDKTLKVGILESFDNNEIIIREIPNAKAKNISSEAKFKIPLSECKKVKTVFEWNSH